RMSYVVEKNADIAAGLVADHDVGEAVSVDIYQGNVRGALPRGQGNRGAKRPVRSLESDLDAVIDGGGDTNVVEPVAGKVACDTPCQQPGRCEGRGVVEGAVGAVGVQRNRIAEHMLDN